MGNTEKRTHYAVRSEREYLRDIIFKKLSERISEVLNKRKIIKNE